MTELIRNIELWVLAGIVFLSSLGSALFYSDAGLFSNGIVLIIASLAFLLIAIYTSSLLAELCSLFPKAGGIYEFGKHSYSKFSSFIIGWLAWLVGNLTIVIPVYAAISFLFPSSALIVKISAGIVILFILNIVAYRGATLTDLLILAFSSIIIMSFLAFFFKGVFLFDNANYNAVSFSSISFIIAIFYLLGNLIGIESLTYLSEEVNDKINISRAFIFGTLASGLFLIILAIISFGMIPQNILLNQKFPLKFLTQSLFGNFSIVLNFGFFMALIGSAFISIIAMPRLVCAMAADKLLPFRLRMIHNEFNTPYRAIVFQSIVSVVILVLAFNYFSPASYILLFLGIILYAIIVFTVTHLRFKKPAVKRDFKAFFGKTGPIIMLLFLISMLIFWIFSDFRNILAYLAGIFLILIGIPVYYALKAYYDPDINIKLKEIMFDFSMMQKKILLSKKERQNLIDEFGELKNKNLVVFGTSFLPLTINLAEQVRPYGKIYLIDSSKNKLFIAKKKFVAKKQGHANVIYDGEKISGIPKSITSFDGILCLDALDEFDDFKKVLGEMWQLLPLKAKICLVHFHKSYSKLTWIDDDKKIKNMFSDSGFEINIKRKTLLTNHILITGEKIAIRKK